jgi:nucleoid DNA-binding protein
MAAKKSTKKKTTAKKTAAKKTTARKTAAKKTTARKTAAKKTTAKKTTAKKTTAKKTTAKKTTARKTAAKKTTARKTTAKKTTAKKTAAKKTTATSTVKKVKGKSIPVKASFTKTQIQSYLADTAAISKKQVVEVLDNLSDLIERHVNNRNIGEFTLPGLLKVKVVRKPATKARKGINPFTGEETTFKAKPARNVVKIKPLKKLKDMVA